MTAMQSTNSTMPADIDIFKHRHEMLTGIPSKKHRRRLTITNSLEDVQRRSASLSSHNLRVQIGFEATGNYHRTFTHHPYKSGFELKLVSSVELALTREALHNIWGKTDPKDAKVILRILKIGVVQFFHGQLVTADTADIKAVSAFVETTGIHIGLVF